MYWAFMYCVGYIITLVLSFEKKVIVKIMLVLYMLLLRI